MATLIRDHGFQWKRSSAISATLALHGLALVAILAPPAYVAMERAAPAPVLTVSVKKEEPPPPPPPPDLNVQQFKPKVPVRVQPVRVRTPPADPIVTRESTPMSTAAVDVPVDPGPVIEAAPAETAPSALSYASRTPIPYPSGRSREEGTVILRVLVGPDGVPQDITIEKSSGFVRLDRAAKAGVMKWRFQPGTRNGQPIAAYGLVPIAFKVTEL